MNHRRVIVTGSRDWSDWEKLYAALMDEYRGWTCTSMTIVHGGCSTGADAFAEQAAKLNAKLSVKSEIYEADWSQYGKAAGPIRNQRMVDDGADIVLAFPLESSKGTWDCVRRAGIAGLEVRIIK